MLNLGITISQKQNALSVFKLLSCVSGSYIPYEISSGIVIANSILKLLIIPEYHVGVYHKGSSNANDRTLIFDVSYDYVF